MLSLARLGATAVLLLALASTLALPARAQGLLESLFGLGSSSHPKPAAQPFPPIGPSYRAPAFVSKTQEPLPRREADLPRAGRYRTLCVRMCDGYYWPVSFTASRQDFGRDAKVCKASCDSEARLFFHDNASGDTSSMVDLSGRAYARLPQAFQYRKSLASGCTCRAAPWAQSEVDRHQTYAAVAATTVVAGAATDAPVAEVIAGAAEPAGPKPALSQETTAEASPGNSDPHDSGSAVARAAGGPAAPTVTADAVQVPTSDGGTHPPPAAARPPLPLVRTTRAAPAPPRGRPAAAQRGPSVVPRKVATTKPSVRPKQLERTRIAAAAPAAPSSKPPYGLGGGKLRWPGD